VGRSALARWAVDATSVGAAVGVLLVVGPRPFGDPPAGPGTTASLTLTWAAVAAALLVVAIATYARRPPRATGAGGVALALVIAGLASVDTSPVIRVAAVAAGAAFVLAVANFVGVVLETRSRAAFVIVGAATIVAVAARVTVRDPFRDLWCAPYCRDNPLLVAARADWVVAADRMLAAVALGWCVLAVVQVARSRLSVWSRSSAALGVAAVAIGSLIALSEPGWTTWSDPSAWVPGSVPATLIPAFLLAAHPHLQVWRTRVQARTLSAALADTLQPDGVAERLQRAVHDPSIRLLFLTASGTYLGPDGVLAERDSRQAATKLDLDGEAIVLIEHRPRSRGQLAAALTPAVTVAVENERLRVLASAELAELRASRRRIVERADAARRRLERDLHDGAQQRLLLLGMELARAAESADDGQRERYRAAIHHTRDALAELRELVHDQIPPVLDELGLVEAIRSLAETSPIPLVIDVEPSSLHRPPAAVERAIYRLGRSMMEDGKSAGASKVSIRLTDEGGQFTAILKHDAAHTIDPTDDEDRVGAAGGRLLITTGPDGVEYVASFP
jgi:signal transduction histidine kinase